MITPSSLAHRVVESPWDLRIVDLRPAQEFAKERIPGSENVEPPALPDLGLQYLPPAKTLVVVNGGKREIPAAINAYKGRVVLLDGGFAAWKNYALATPVAPAAGASRSATDEYLFRIALNQSLTGAKAAAPVLAAPKSAVPRPQKKGGGCSS
jgi:rhodanese-related sulfurtransferase